MKRNMGTADRLIRLIIALLIAVLYFTDTISGTVGIVLLIVAGVFLFTALTNWCGLYQLIGISTCKIKNA